MLPPNGVGPKGVAAPNSSKVRVIIVGLGIAGLTAAIECHRKGHSVIAFDRLDVLQRYGDVIGIGANGGMVIGQWGNEVRDALREWIHVTPQLDIYDGNGKSIGQHTYSATHEEKYMLRRSMLADIMYRQAQSLGIDMRLGVKVSDFWEDDHEAGVIVNGEKIGADCVIGADAHVTPPTSGQGGGQAIEDAAVLSICLELAGRENVPLALRATETIRKPRATYVQKNGFSAQMAMFGDDWKKEGKDDNELPSGSMDAWIWEHDCQSHAYSEYAKVVKALKENSVYTPTNLAESVIGTVSS
ncbi:hypothetical protein BDV59DRAFT_200769 [Aspergillus ambiguus]|uniref:FAD-dependent oxidoreductase n=1 Tax=Aspergillus ambiguus TaxID=176160 RepID=UPI003CCC9962